MRKKTKYLSDIVIINTVKQQAKSLKVALF